MNAFRKVVLVLPIVLIGQFVFAQASEKFIKDSLIVIGKSPEKGFYNEYVLFIPKGTPRNKPVYVLVEPNNTGKTSDSLEVHKNAAIDLASQRSVGNNVSTELKIPILVPIFPRQSSKELVYTHALDRDVMLEKSSDLKRLDLQLIAMVKDAKRQLQEAGVSINDKILMNGFSASATFTNRFVMLHPELVKAAAMGGLNGELILPLKSYSGKKFSYPLGINDLKKISGIDFNPTAYRSVVQYIYMGAQDDNDAVQYDDAYDQPERDQINQMLGKDVQSRWKNVQKIYLQEKVNVRFRTYPEVGHWTTREMNLNTILFFKEFLNQ